MVQAREDVSKIVGTSVQMMIAIPNDIRIINWNWSNWINERTESNVEI